MTATAVLDPPGAAMSAGTVGDPGSVQIPSEALPALLDQAQVPRDLHDRITARILVGDLTWTDGPHGLVVQVPPSRTTTVRTTRPVKVYRVEETRCTCRGFYARGGCYHPWLWAVLHAFLHPPIFTVTGDAALTLEQPLLLAALDLIEHHAAGEITLWLGGANLVLEWTTTAMTAAQFILLGLPVADGEATARGPRAALKELLRTCPANLPAVTLVAAPTGLTWSTEVPI